MPASEIDRDFLRSLDILYVEDADFTREALAYYLKRKFNRVVVASDGAEGLACARNHGFHAVLTDITMPRMDGLEMTRRIKAETPGLPIIVITAHSEPEMAETARQAGADSLILKPFLPEQVAAEIYRLTRGKTA